MSETAIKRYYMTVETILGVPCVVSKEVHDGAWVVIHDVDKLLTERDGEIELLRKALETIVKNPRGANFKGVAEIAQEALTKPS